MSDEINDLKNLWQGAKKTAPTESTDLDKLIKEANRKKQETTRFHLWNIVILSVVLSVIVYYFYYLFHFNELISRIGHGLMAGGLAVRILIEMVSMRRSANLDLSQNVAQSTKTALEFYRFRKLIHGPVTFSIVALYTIGFYMLTPEFSQYFSLNTMILMDGSYVIGAIILVWQIRKGIRNEMQNITDILRFQESMKEEKEDA